MTTKYHKLKDKRILREQIAFKIPQPIIKLVQDYFLKCFAANPKIKFDGPLKKKDAVTLFLNWFVTYRAAREYGKEK
jgi:hypothetical protein